MKSRCLGFFIFCDDAGLIHKMLYASGAWYYMLRISDT